MASSRSVSRVAVLSAVLALSLTLVAGIEPAAAHPTALAAPQARELTNRAHAAPGADRAGVPRSAATLSVEFQVAPNQTEELLPARFTSAVNGTGPFTYLWNFGDNITSALPDPTHAYTVYGREVVTLTVYGANGSWGAATQDVGVAEPVGITGPIDPPSGAEGAGIALAITAYYGVPPYTYFWEFGDLNGSHEESPTHTYARPGTYDVTVWVNDSVGGSASFSELVLVTNPHATTSSNGSSGSGSSGPNWTVFWIGAGGGIGAGAIIIAIGFGPRRK